MLIGVNPGLEDPEERRLRREWDGAWASLLRDAGLAEFVRKWEGLDLLTPEPSHDPGQLEVAHQGRLTQDAEQLARVFLELGLGAMPAYGTRLAELPCSVLLVCGANDAACGARREAMLPRLRRASRVSIERSGHDPLIDNPEALARALRALCVAGS
jgi:2-succinyl-6-hydroxy-2,4-cyclohexadiene-1-carboxylate synthase